MFIGLFLLLTTIVSTVTLHIRHVSAHSQESSHDSQMHEVMKNEDIQAPACEDNSWFDRSAASPCGPGNTIKDQEPKSALDVERG